MSTKYVFIFNIYVHATVIIWAAVKINCLCLVHKYKLSLFGGAYRFPVFCSKQHEILQKCKGII